MSATCNISDLDFESAFRISYRKFDLDFVYHFSITYNVSGIWNADSKSKSLICNIKTCCCCFESYGVAVAKAKAKARATSIATSIAIAISYKHITIIHYTYKL